MGHFLPIRHCVWPKKALFCTESSKKCVNRDKSWYRDKKRMLGLLISSESKLFGEGPSCLRTTSAKFWRNCVIYNPFTIPFCKPICPNHNLFPKQLWWIETQPPPFDHWSAGCRASWWTEGRGRRADKAPGVWSLAAQGCSRGDQGSGPLLTDCSPLFALAAVDIWTGWPDSHRGNIWTCL